MKNSKLLFSLIFLFFLENSYGQWNQIGFDIEGPVSSQSGIVSISNDGSVIAIAEAVKKPVVVFKKINDNWVQLGDTLNNYSGAIIHSSVSVSGDGSVVAVGNVMFSYYSVGIVSVFKFENNNWVLKGNIIKTNNNNDNFGISVSLNYDGSVVAVGASKASGDNPEEGFVYVYRFYNGDWVTKGQELVGSNSYDNFGTSVSISNSGDTMVVGEPNNDYNTGELSDNRGQIRIFNYVDSDSVWVQFASNIHGYFSGDHLGESVSISKNGKCIIAGTKNTENGYVDIYKYNTDGVNENWLMLGDPIFSTESNDFFGFSTSINFEGSVIAIGAMYGGELNNGKVYIYKFINNNWGQLGTIIGKNAYDHSAKVSLNSEGNIIAIGATGNDGGSTDNNDDRGSVSVYKYLPEEIINKLDVNSFNFYPNPFENNIVIENNDNINIYTINIYTITGEIMKSINISSICENANIDLCGLNAGVYIIEVVTTKGNIYKKIIKK